MLESLAPVDALGTNPRVLIVGCGLLGTSLGLALASNSSVYLRDISPTNCALARDLGAGSDNNPESVDLAIVAVPPDVTAACVRGLLFEFPNAIVTDVASAKSMIAAELADIPAQDLKRYVGSHPMAGRERSGPEFADGELFVGRPWVIATRDDVQPRALQVVRALAQRVGSVLFNMDAQRHDAAVAAVSHVPQIMSSLTAGCLTQMASDALSLAGQGLRDTTRIAASDPKLWRSIILYNASAITGQLRSIHDQLGELIEALEAAARDELYAPGATATVAAVISKGNTGVAMIPGKHGGAPRRYAEVTVLVPDEPGQLARLLADVGNLGVNLEDFGLEHSHGAPMGAARLQVMPAVQAQLFEGLMARGWRVVNG